jgi:hypothetical protein
MKKYSVFFLLLMSCNYFEDTAKKDTKEAIFYDAQRKIDKHDYDAAITLFESLDSEFRAQRDVSVIYASAYSGRCGLDFVDLVQNLTAMGSADSVFLSLMQTFPGGTDAKIADCVKAQDILNGIGDSTVRNPSENVLMGFSSFAKVGTVLSRFADTDADGALDAGFDHCDLTLLPDDAVREVGTGIAVALLSIASAGDGIGGSGLTNVTNFCALDPTLNNFCTTTDKTAFSVLEVAALRAIIGSTVQGIGACAGDFTSCICP